MSEKKTKRKQENKAELIYLVIIIPALFVVAVVSLILLNKIAKTNRQVCKYLGGLWLEGRPSAENPNPRHECFTYEELYQ
jgi:hypothetical protein